VWNVRWAETLWRDVRHGTRTLRKNVGFSFVAVLTLALGIGANTAIFSALDALLLRPLPFAHADRLVRLYASKNGVVLPAPGGPSPPDARDYAQASRSFDQIVVYDIWRKNVSFTGAAAEPEQMRVGLVPAGFRRVRRNRSWAACLRKTRVTRDGITWPPSVHTCGQHVSPAIRRFSDAGCGSTTNRTQSSRLCPT
jgi:hypothetical protein